MDEGRVAAGGEGRGRRVGVDGHAELELSRLAGGVELEEADERRAAGPDPLTAELAEQLGEGAVDRLLDGAGDVLAQPEVGLLRTFGDLRRIRHALMTVNRPPIHRPGTVWA